MHLASHHRSPSRLATQILLLLAVAAASLTLTQCRMVGDRLTGVSVGPFKRPGSCFDACYDRYRRQIKSESDLHVSLIKNCNGDKACEEEEEARHEAALENIQAEREACLNTCHQQGRGTAGQ